MTWISIKQGSSTAGVEAISVVFLRTGMTNGEADYYAAEVTSGRAFEIEAPDSDMVRKMIRELEDLDLELDVV